MRIKLRKSDVSKNRELVTELMKAAYEGSKS